MLVPLDCLALKGENEKQCPSVHVTLTLSCVHGNRLTVSSLQPYSLEELCVCIRIYILCFPDSTLSIGGE